MTDCKEEQPAPDNLARFFDNFALLLRLPRPLREPFLAALRLQPALIVGGEPLEPFRSEEELEQQAEEDEVKLLELEQLLRQLCDPLATGSAVQEASPQLTQLLADLQAILDAADPQQALRDYDPFPRDRTEREGTSEIDIPGGHFFREKIETCVHYGPAVFSHVRPLNHQLYISEAGRAYEDVAPYRLKNICVGSEDPAINRPNHFQEGIDPAKAILAHPLPGTAKLAYYLLSDLAKTPSAGRELYRERQLGNDWTFSAHTRTATTSDGRIFAVNCRTTPERIDPYLYEITEAKASNRGPLPSPLRDTSIIAMGGYVYLLGGRGEGEKVSRKAYRYSIRDKKWSQLAESNVGVRKATVCTVSGRYLCKLGGLNEFDYISKVIEMYDCLTDKWSLVRASPRNILE